MRHRKKKSRLSLSRSKRKAMLAAISRSILLNGRINTTKDRAKNAKRLIDRLITLGKAGSLAAKRQAYKVLPDHALVSRLFNEIAPRFKTRAGGYTRVILTSRRRGDNAQMALLELVEVIGTVKSKTTPKQENIEQAVEGKSKIKEPAKKALPVLDKKENLKGSEKPKPAPEESKKDEKTEVQDKKKPPKKFIGGLRRFFKKERDSL